MTPEERFNELKPLILAAVRACSAAVLGHLAEDAYVPTRFSDYAYKVSYWDKSLMPRVERKSSLGGALDYSRIFVRDPEKAGVKAIAYSSIDELMDLRNWVIEQPDIVEILAPPKVPTREEFDEDDIFGPAFMVELGAFDLALGIVDYLAHTSGLEEIDQEELDTLASSIAWGLVTPEPHIETVAPLLLARFEDEERVDLVGYLALEKMSETFIREKARARSGNQLDSTLSDCATHALVRTGHYLVDRKRPWRLKEATWPTQDFDLFLSCLRAATGTDTGYNQIVVRPVGWDQGFRADLRELARNLEQSNYPRRIGQHGWLSETPFVSTEELRQADALYEVVQGLDSVHPIRVALRRLSTGMLRSEPSDALLDYCIGLEALLGEDSPSEVTHKLALRAAAVLRATDEDADAREVFDAVKLVYRTRSKVVHGRTGKNPEITIGSTTLTATEAALFVLRRALQAVILNRSIWKPKAVDELLILGAFGELPTLQTETAEEE